VASSLLSTKFYIPPAHKNIVPRPRLVQQLNEAWEQENKLILISASAGYGKTTLIADWLRMAPVKSAWLSLDAADNDPTRFLAYFIAALRQIDEHIGQTVQPMLKSPQPLPTDVVQTALINEITQLPAAFILVLDDYQVIQAMPVHQHLSFLVDHLPPQMHLVIITREDPPLPLDRLRVRGQTLEIRRGDLRFSLEECAGFLQRMMGIALSPDGVAALEQRTEGWITGLQARSCSSVTTW